MADIILWQFNENPVMEWNLKTPSDWDLENLAIFSGKAIEVPKKVQLPIHESGGDAGVDNGSIYSSGGTGLSGFSLGHGFSSKSSISASADSSSKEGIKTFGTVHDLPKDFNEKEELARLSHNGSSPTQGASIESDEPMGCLKFGKRSCLDDTCAATTASATSFSVTTSSATTKKSRVTYQSTKTPRCQVEGCNLELKSAKDYHRRHRICERHSKSPKVIVAGMVRRFCQQCSRFHDLSEFDDKKRSCRKRLYDHNARRRRPLPDTIQSTSLRLSSSLYDGRRQMDLLLNKVPTEVSNPTSQSACSFKVTHARDSLIRTAKSGVINRQLDLSSDEMPVALSMLHLDSDNAVSLQETTRRVLNHGLEASAIASNLNVAPDVRRALSLLSTNYWGLNEPGPTSLEKLMHANQIGVAQPVMHAEPQNGAIASSEYVQVEQTPSQSRVQSLDFHNNGSSQFQEFQLFKAPYESSCFYSSRIN